MQMIDTASNVFSHLGALKTAGVTSVGRYYCSGQSWKLLTAREAQAIRGAGMSVVAVYEDGADPGTFSGDSGSFAAQRALQCAQAVQQESGTAIYFAVGFDADEGAVDSRIAPYFQAVRAVFQGANSHFRIGVYGSGLACRKLLDADLCELAWLSQSTGYREHAAFKASNRWAIAQGPTTKIGGLGVDPNETRGDFGAFPPSSALAVKVVGHALASPAAAAAAAPSTPFDAAQAALLGSFVAAAYSMFDANPGNLTPAQSPDFPPGYSLTAWIQMQDFIVADGPPMFYGFIAQSQAQPGQCVLAIRGTSNPEEWWDDVNAAYRNTFKDPGCGTVGSGFAKIYDTLEVVEAPGAAHADAQAPRSLKAQGGFAQQVAAHVRGLSSRAAQGAGPAPNGSIAVVGHSLGSALATLYTLDNAISERLAHPALCTFASPLVGDGTFAAKFNSLALTSWRIVNRPDLVPNVPPTWFGFVHVNSEVMLDSKGAVKPTVGCWHSLQTYLHLLDASIALSSGCAA